MPLLEKEQIHFCLKIQTFKKKPVTNGTYQGSCWTFVQPSWNIRVTRHVLDWNNERHSALPIEIDGNCWKNVEPATVSNVKIPIRRGSQIAKLKFPLYSHSRYNDVKSAWATKKNEKRKLDNWWLGSNQIPVLLGDAIGHMQMRGLVSFKLGSLPKGGLKGRRMID